MADHVPVEDAYGRAGRVGRPRRGRSASDRSPSRRCSTASARARRSWPTPRSLAGRTAWPDTPGRPRDDRRDRALADHRLARPRHRRGASRSGPILGRVRELGIVAITAGEPRYPRRLAAVEMPPHVLFVAGDPTILDRDRAVAVVGTRRATSFGRAIAGRIAPRCAARRDRRVRARLRHRRRGARGDGPRRRDDRRGHRWRPRRGDAARPRSPRGGDPRVGGGAIVSEFAPDVEPTGARSRGATGSSAAWPMRRSSSRRRPAAGRSSPPPGRSSRARAASSCPVRSTRRHRRAVSASCASSTARRGSWPASRSSSRTSACLAAGRRMDHELDAPRQLRPSKRWVGRSGGWRPRSSTACPRSTRSWPAGPAGRHRPRHADAARATRARHRRPRALPAGRRAARRDPDAGPSLGVRGRRRRLPVRADRCYPRHRRAPADPDVRPTPTSGDPIRVRQRPWIAEVRPRAPRRPRPPRRLRRLAPARLGGLVRSAAALGLGAVLGIGLVAVVRPAATTATPPTDIVPLTPAAFRTIVVDRRRRRQPATIEFSTPMDRASVAASIPSPGRVPSTSDGTMRRPRW